jgi:GAF domain-containing protein
MAGTALQRHNEALRRLARRTAWHRGGRDAAFREALTITSEVLGVARAGVWLYDESHERMRCALLLDTTKPEFGSGAVIEGKDCPTYFRAIEQERIVAADDARKDPRTIEFTESSLVNGLCNWSIA